MILSIIKENGERVEIIPKLKKESRYLESNETDLFLSNPTWSLVRFEKSFIDI